MADEEKKKSFWETLPGIITAIAALLGSIAALVAALGGSTKESAAKPDSPAVVTPSVNDEAAKRAAAAEAKAKAEVDAAKAEVKKAKAEAAEAKTRAAEAERKAAAARAEMEEKKVVEPPKAAVPKQGDVVTDDTGMTLVYVPTGCFDMGSPPDDEDHREDEGPVHNVCVDGFWMGKYEVTQGQWQKIMGSNPASFKKGSNYPVEQVFWEDAQQFISKLNKKSGKNYRLPTEAEWEYACRANGSGKYCGGDNLDALAWYEKNSGNSTHPVGGKKANDFGLHDMSGNVWEWCADWYEDGYYASSPKDNPTGSSSSSSSYRVIRGGSWGLTPGYVRAANRYWLAADGRDDDLGFRLLLPGQQGQAGR